MTDGVSSFEEEAPSTEEMAQRIAAAIEWLVGVDERGRVLGFAYAARHHERAAYRWAADVSVYVDGGARRQGVGRRLYVALLDRLSLRGLRIACAGITLPNDASVGLHESLGFRPVGVYRSIGYKHGAWWDVGWWQLALGEGDAGGAPAEPQLD